MPRCKECKDKFIVKYFLQKFCMLKDECIKAFADGNKIKDWKIKKAIMVEKLLTHKDYLQMLQVVFNTYIRIRDKDLPCISCGTLSNVKYDAGHFWNAGNNQFLRFNEDNVNKQCGNNCNVHLSGNFGEYRIGLIEKIGIERVDILEQTRHFTLKLSIAEIKEQILIYKSKIKLLK